MSLLRPGVIKQLKLKLSMTNSMGHFIASVLLYEWDMKVPKGMEIRRSAYDLEALNVGPPSQHYQLFVYW